MPRILLVAKMAKNGRRQKDVHPKKQTVLRVDPLVEVRQQKTLVKKARLREHAAKYAEDVMAQEAPDRSAAAKFDTYILHLKGHVLDLHHAAFTARL
jgi:hypothetical protein